MLERAAEKGGCTCDDLGTSGVLAGLDLLSIVWAHDPQMAEELIDHLESNLHTGPLRFGARPATRNA